MYSFLIYYLKYRLDFLTFFSLIVLANLTAEAQQRPNVVILIADDMSSIDMSCAGNKNVKTPNIDQLAASGIRFTNAFLTTSSCSPSRASIITGRYPHNTGAAELHSEIPADQIAFPKLLKDAGYYTAQAGKWHFGSSGVKPEGIFLNAFDRTGGSVIDGGGNGGEKKWVTYLQERPKEKPFFFWFASHDAHRNWDKDPKPVTYSEDELAVPAHLYNSKITRQDLKSYYEEVSRFDFYVGEVVKELKKEGIFDNTLIIVMADNGRPFPGYKTRLYDEGIKTPFVIHWGERIKNKGAVAPGLLSVIDIAPTIFEAANVKQHEGFQGKSFLKLIDNPTLKFRNYVFAEHNWHDFKANERMVRTEKYLYIENGLTGLSNLGAIDVMGGGAGEELKKAYLNKKTTPLQSSIFIVPQPAVEFYDCIIDPKNTVNQAGNRSVKSERERLRDVLNKWRAETGDSQPLNLTPDWYSRETYKPLPDKDTRGTMPGSENKATIINRPGPF